MSSRTTAVKREATKVMKSAVKKGGEVAEAVADAARPRIKALKKAAAPKIKQAKKAAAKQINKSVKQVKKAAGKQLGKGMRQAKIVAKNVARKTLEVSAKGLKKAAKSI